MTKVIARQDGVVMKEMDEAVFLVNPKTNAIYQLNVTGAAVWRLLAEPACMKEVITTLAAAFPQVERKQLESDLARLIADLVAKGLVVGGP